MKNVRFFDSSSGEILVRSLGELRVGRMRRRSRAWSRALAGQSGDLILVTLTYRDVDGWSARHVSEFMRHVRRFLGQGLLGYMWVAELQRRGAVHYHVILMVSPGRRIPMPDEVGWWEHGMTRVQLVRNPQRVWGYVRKYVSKGDFGEFPPGLRLFAVVIRAVLGLRRWLVRWFSVPLWVRQALDGMGVCVDEGSTIRHVTGGWQVGGIVVSSPWRFTGVVGS